MRYKKRKYFLAGRINLIQRSKIRELFEKARKMENVISLGIGEPDFDTPLRSSRRPRKGPWMKVTPTTPPPTRVFPSSARP